MVFPEELMTALADTPDQPKAKVTPLLRTTLIGAV